MCVCVWSHCSQSPEIPANSHVHLKSHESHFMLTLAISLMSLGLFKAHSNTAHAIHLTVKK